MKKLYKVIVLWVFIAIANLTYACDEGNITLKDVIESSKKIADIKPSRFVHKDLPGSIIKINGVKYELRFFSFEDTLDNLPKDMSFYFYVSENNLLLLPSKIIAPLEGIAFETFDFRRVNLEDGVYFSMALRKVL